MGGDGSRSTGRVVLYTFLLTLGAIAIGWHVDVHLKEAERVQSLFDVRAGPNVRAGERELMWWMLDANKAVCYMDVKSGSIACVPLQNWKGPQT